MRAVFGLVGILVTVGVIVWFLGSGGGLDHTKNVIDSGNKARTEVSQIAGQDTETGERASASVDLEPLTSGGRLAGVLVTRVSDGGAYQRYFGLQRNDTIIAVEYSANRQNFKDIADSEMATAQIDEAYRRKGAIYVVRDEKEVKLPAAPSGASESSRDPMQRQLDAIQQIPGAR